MSGSNRDKPQTDQNGRMESIYRLESGTYEPVIGSASIILDSCGTGRTPQTMEVCRQLQHDGMGNLTLRTSDGSLILGSGTVLRNNGTLSSNSLSFSDGKCQWRSRNVIEFTATADNRFDIVLTQYRDFTMQVMGGMTCTQPQECVFKFRISHKL